MAEPVINVMRDLIVPIGERLRADERFADVKNIIYDVDEISFSEMPCIEYYVESNFEDVARGSGGYSLQTRRLTARIVFTLWVYDAQSRQRMDEALFHIGGLLLDWLREGTDFNRAAGWGLSKTPLTWQVFRPESPTGYTGVHQVRCEFDVYS